MLTKWQAIAGAAIVLAAGLTLALLGIMVVKNDAMSSLGFVLIGSAAGVLVPSSYKTP